eukprot:TRINITY_DN13188_c1_g1_i2.p1 TRINITY_DN13188_c1_g1~~TRINITY_DN13188_c1_g1_i2.p1  ORF type:complete len:1007 (+),score=205.08 TRINITY_DN13188_c1_g1_i2:70-3090(+)
MCRTGLLLLLAAASARGGAPPPSTSRPTNWPTYYPTDPTAGPTLFPTRNPVVYASCNDGYQYRKCEASVCFADTKCDDCDATLGLEFVRITADSACWEEIECRLQCPSFEPTRPPTRQPSSSPTGSPSEPPSTSPSQSPSLPPTASPSHSPTTQPTRAPSVSPSWSPTAAPLEPTAQPTRAPRTPTLSPLAPVSFCSSRSDGAECPGDGWEVTLDRCSGGECQHIVAAAAVQLQLFGAEGTTLNLSVPVDFTGLGALDQAAVGGEHCAGMLGVSAPGDGVLLLQDRLQGPLNISAYQLHHSVSVTPARLLVGWRLAAQMADGGGWQDLANESSKSALSFELLDSGRVSDALSNASVLAVRLYATAVRGDTPYDCGGVNVAVVAAAAAFSCCCVGLWTLAAVFLSALCGFGVVALRSMAQEPAIDAPWMGSKDQVMANVLECYEELERRWAAKQGGATEEAAEWLSVPPGEDPFAVLAAHAGGPWRTACSEEPQLRALPAATLELIRRYSHEAQDTDYICRLPGAPRPFASYKAADPDHPKEARAAWQGYKKACEAKCGRKSVNRALYSEVNRCTREAAEGGSEAPEAWKALDSIIKQTGLLIATAAHAADPPLPAAGLPVVKGPPRQRWIRMLSLPDAVRERFASLKPGMYLAWSVAVASVTANAKASADFMAGGPGKCVLVCMTAPQDKARALALGSASLYGGEGELLLALGTMFRVRRVTRGRILSRYVQPTAASPLTLRQLWAAVRKPLLVVDVEWVADSSPPQWCAAARRLCECAARADTGKQKQQRQQAPRSPRDEQNWEAGLLPSTFSGPHQVAVPRAPAGAEDEPGAARRPHSPVQGQRRGPRGKALLRQLDCQQSPTADGRASFRPKSGRRNCSPPQQRRPARACGGHAALQWDCSAAALPCSPLAAPLEMPGERAGGAKRSRSKRPHNTSPVSRARAAGRVGSPPPARGPFAAVDPLAQMHSAAPSRGSPASILGPASSARLSAAPRRAAPAAAVDL